MKKIDEFKEEIISMQSKLHRLENNNNSLIDDFKSALEKAYFARTGKHSKLIAIIIDDCYGDAIYYSFLFSDGGEEPWCSGAICTDYWQLPCICVSNPAERKRKITEFIY